MVFHMVVLLVLALWMMPEAVTSQVPRFVVAPGEEEEFDEIEELEEPEFEEVNVDVQMVETEAIPEEVQISPADDMEAAAVQVELSEFGLEHAPRNDLTATVGAYSGSALEGRGMGTGAKIRAGASQGSEKAVAMALEWLAYHQMPDGGWNFNHGLCPRRGGVCQNPGSATKARNAATGLALLPFLGAGQTHTSGKYKSTVKNGLYYLVSHMDRRNGALNEPEGNMYSHGIAAIALCEAYAMTHDKGLYQPAQAAVNFICYAQDPVGGGWRYQPRTPGDTSVVGWQLMALKSGHMAYLRIPPVTIQKASQYLDSVAGNSGANYGYNKPGSGQATTAIGLLCRMYLGWKHDNPALQKGVQSVSNQGVSKSNMYYNYYATQVMRHWEGDEWKKWNDSMRDWLVNSQVKEGPERGSWYMAGGHSERGGRLYCTSMATMMLEVYYRHLPIYRKQSTEEEFPE